MYRKLRTMWQYICIPFYEKFHKFIYNALKNEEEYLLYLMELFVYKNLTDDEKVGLFENLLEMISTYKRSHYDNSEICLPEKFIYYILWGCHMEKYTQTYISYLFPDLISSVDYSYHNLIKFIDDFMKYIAARLSNVVAIPEEEFIDNLNKLLRIYQNLEYSIKGDLEVNEPVNKEVNSVGV